MNSQQMTIAELERFLEGKVELTSAEEAMLRDDNRKGAARLLNRFLRKKELKLLENARLEKMLAEEKILWQKGFSLIAGIDEAGRGPLAGPVVAAAVIFDPETMIEGINDSKQLSAAKREELFEEIIIRAVDYGIGSASRDEIDRINIHAASMLAMKRAVERLKTEPDYLLVDGFKIPRYPLQQKALTSGDKRSMSIAAASILAKVTRDKIMSNLHNLYPQYGFDSNKGYGTLAHRQALIECGPCSEHRVSFVVK